MSVPAINISDCGDTYHFGGSLQTDPSLPTNYVAWTLHLQSQRNNSFVTRMLLSYLEGWGLMQNIADFTIVLAGEREDELPERALCTTRVARSTLSALPMSSISLHSGDDYIELQAIEPPRQAKREAFRLYFRIFVLDPLLVASKSLARSIEGLRHVHPASPVNALLQRSPKNRGTHQRASIVATSDPFEQAVNELVNILEEVRVPVRQDPGPDDLVAASLSNNVVSDSLSTLPISGELGEQSILRTVTRSDMQRYFMASDCSLKTASVRLVESSVWRALTFPIDTRTCRVELQCGQFFQQGVDLDGNPVFYFRNTCLGPWRKDDDAVISAVLHRLESSLADLAKDDPFVQCTLIVLMGRPYRKSYRVKDDAAIAAASKGAKGKEEDRTEQDTVTAASTAVSTLQDGGDESSEEEEDFDEASRLAQTNNPRVYRDEVWNTHTSRTLIERLIDILLAHYPERLSKALVVVGYKNKRYVRYFGGALALTSVVGSAKTRDKVRFLTSYHDLYSYVDRSQLVSLVGGTQRVDMQHYECI